MVIESEERASAESRYRAGPHRMCSFAAVLAFAFVAERASAEAQPPTSNAPDEAASAETAPDDAAPVDVPNEPFAVEVTPAPVDAASAEEPAVAVHLETEGSGEVASHGTIAVPGAAIEPRASSIPPGTPNAASPAAAASAVLPEAADVARIRETRGLLVQRVESARERHRTVAPRLPGPIVSTLLGGGLIAGGLVARPQLTEMFCEEADDFGNTSVDADCARPIRIAGYGVAGLGAGLVTMGVIKIVLHSVRRVRARRERSAAEEQLERFDRQHVVDIDAHVVATPDAQAAVGSLLVSF